MLLLAVAVICALVLAIAAQKRGDDTHARADVSVVDRELDKPAYEGRSDEATVVVLRNVENGEAAENDQVVLTAASTIDGGDRHDGTTAQELTTDAALLEFEMPDIVHGFCMCHPFSMLRALHTAALQAPADDPEVAESTDRGIYRFFPSDTRRGVRTPRDTGPVR